MSKTDEKEQKCNEEEEITEETSREEAESCDACGEEETSEEKVMSEIDLLKEQLADTEALRLRLLADFDNYKKRTAREKESFLKYANEDLLLSLIPVMDNMELALASIKGQKEDDGTFKGIEMVYSQLLEVLEKNGLSAIDAEGKPFDPNLHEAVMKEEKEGVDSNIVLEVFRKGYKYYDKVLRPSMVKVSI